jgi:hypothetical protein
MRITMPIVRLLAATLPVLLTGCGQPRVEEQPWGKLEVEVSPGMFIDVRGRADGSDHPVGSNKRLWESYEMRVEWHGVTVIWKATARPLHLRAFKDRLYVIGLDRVSREGECAFRYFVQQGETFKEIPASEYPRAIAGQNLGFGNRYFGALDTLRDAVQIARDQDPTDTYFRNSLSAYIWNQLATGETYEESVDKWLIDEGTLHDYIRTNAPIKLTAIVRTTAEKRSQSAAEPNE